jgi:hypothetical protein
LRAGRSFVLLKEVMLRLEIDAHLPQAVLLEHSLSESLKRIARGKGISLETLVNLWLEQRLTESRSHG